MAGQGTMDHTQLPACGFSAFAPMCGSASLPMFCCRTACVLPHCPCAASQHVDGEWDGAGFSKFRVDDVDLIHRDNAHEKDVVERTYDLMKQHITAADDSGVITLKSFKSYLGSHDKDHRNVQELVPLNTFQSDKMFKQMSQGGSTVNLEQFRAWWATIHEVPTRASC